MKIKNAPRSLQNLPRGYSLDIGDYQDINKHREQNATKNRVKSKIRTIVKEWMKEIT